IWGLDPSFADYTRMPDLTPELVRSLIDSQLARLRSFGYIRLPGGSSETVEAEAARYLGNRNYERVDRRRFHLARSLIMARSGSSPAEGLVRSSPQYRRCCLDTRPPFDAYWPCKGRSPSCCHR